MPNRTFYYDLIGARRMDSAGAVTADVVRLAYQQYDSWRVMLKTNLEGTVSAFDASSVSTWQGAVAQDFTHDLIEGDTYAGYSGAVTSIRIDGLASTPPDSGIIILTNGASESEYVVYTAVTANGTGDYTFTVSVTLTYVYAENDTAQVENTPAMVRIVDANVDDAQKATGQIDVTIDCDTSTFADAVADDEFISGWFELRGYDASANLIVYVQFPVRCLNTLDPSPTTSPGPGGAFYTKAESDAKYALLSGAADIEITDSTKGLILKDRTTSTRYRLLVDEGVLGIESVS